jgi:hypothetical protein
MASWLKAVMLIGTRLMLSSRRVAVTVISSSAGPASPEASASAARGAWLYSVAPLPTMHKYNKRFEINRTNGFGWITVINIPEILLN